MDTQRTRITKRLFCESLIRLMKDKSIENITVTELCREAGINRSTFYRYYTVPSDILSDIQSTIATQYSSTLSKSNDRINQLTHALTIVRTNYERALVLNEEVNRFISSSPDSESSSDIFYTLLAGTVPPPLRQYARHMTSAAVTLWLKNKCQMDEETLAKLLIDVCAVCLSQLPASL